MSIQYIAKIAKINFISTLTSWTVIANIKKTLYKNQTAKGNEISNILARYAML